MVLYIADKKNFPYGEKTKNELVTILIRLTERIQKFFSPALIVLACNTASVSALSELRQRFPATDFVGTVPAVKPALIYSVKKNIAVIGTERTLADDYITRIAEEAAGGGAITRIAAGELVDFVEYRLEYSGKAERITLVKKYTDEARKRGADALALGCTHFLFLLDEFREAAEPYIRVFDSINGVCGRIESVLSKKKPPSPITRRAGQPNPLLVTGGKALDAAEQWDLRAERFNLESFKPDGWDDR
jgi:glutamate racemase